MEEFQSTNENECPDAGDFLDSSSQNSKNTLLKNYPVKTINITSGKIIITNPVYNKKNKCIIDYVLAGQYYLARGECSLLLCHENYFDKNRDIDTYHWIEYETSISIDNDNDEIGIFEYSSFDKYTEYETNKENGNYLITNVGDCILRVFYSLNNDQKPIMMKLEQVY